MLYVKFIIALKNKVSVRFVGKTVLRKPFFDFLLLLLNSTLQMLVFGETVAMLVYEISVFFLFASVYMDLVTAHKYLTGNIFHTI